MKHTVFKSSSPAQTREYAAALAHEILRTKLSNGPMVIALTGSLGTGKTEFVKGFLHACNVRVRAASPSFVIMKRYRMIRKRYRNVYHFDLYRLHTKAIRAALAACGWAAAMTRKSIVVIEWADRATRMIPKGAFCIKISHVKGEHQRYMRISRR